MSLLRPALLALAGLSAAACASVEPAAVAPPPIDAGAPQPLADHDWFLGDEAGWLGYGLAESDDVWLSLSCAPGAGVVEVQQYVQTGPDPVVALESGGETGTWPARPESSEMQGSDILRARADADEPVFQRFRRLGWMAAFGPDQRVMMAGHPGAVGRIERFFTACG